MNMIDYGKPTPETDAFMAKIDGDEIDLEMVRAKLHDMDIERDHLKEVAAFVGVERPASR